MTRRKISDFPEAPYKKYASEAERRGFSITEGLINDPTAVILLGALDMIREMSERLDALEAASVKQTGTQACGCPIDIVHTGDGKSPCGL